MSLRFDVINICETISIAASCGKDTYTALTDRPVLANVRIYARNANGYLVCVDVSVEGGG